MELSLGEKIIVLRERKGLKLVDVARKAWPDLVAPHARLKKIETGIIAPTKEDLKKIATILGTTPDNLVSTDEPVDYLIVNRDVLEHIPELEVYIKILNEGASSLDRDWCVETLTRLIEDLAKKKKNKK